MGADNRSVVWRVRWSDGSATEHELFLTLDDPALVVSAHFEFKHPQHREVDICVFFSNCAHCPDHCVP